MLKEPYTSQFYSRHSKFIKNVLALREPQHESLEIFAKLCDVLSLSKEPDLEAELEAVHALCPTFAKFDRNFPSFCFALATGIGKTRLMGACIAYLRYEKGIRHFFVMAPNLTIYKKLKDDLGNPSNPKYVFRGLDLFATPPRIVDGENYESFRQEAVDVNDVVINVFNIAKLYADSKGSDGAPPRIKRLKEVLGESYFDYLKALPDLYIFMDESHHYHADKSFDVINELKPILGVELTATPQIQKGAKKIPFQNVVYEYSLAHALKDELYVKVPAVFTRQDFRPEEYTPEQLDREKLNDGLRIHEETKSRLEVYARSHGKPLVRPFVLVVAKNTEHSKQIREYIQSADFFGGYYADKVMEINSALRGAEKDENIEKLLSLESPDNKIEIVIHVNMLKEGWDVRNLYTIIPLRASASETLTEQTIGRGLRLPYGTRTGVDEIDRLSIVSHDKYEAIVRLANDPNSLVRKVYFIEESGLPGKDPQRETIELPSAYEVATTDQSFIDQLTVTLQQESGKYGAQESVQGGTTESGKYGAQEGVQGGTTESGKYGAQESVQSGAADKSETSSAEKTGSAPVETVRPIEKIREAAKFVVDYTSRSVMDLNRQVKTYDAVHDPESRDFVKKTVIAETIRRFPDMNLKQEELEAAVEKAIATCVQALTDKVIPIPQTVIQPFTEVRQGFTPFTLDTGGMNWHPSDDTLLGTELREDGRTFAFDSDRKAMEKRDTVENEIIRFIIVHDNVDYASCADLLYALVDEAKRHFLSYLTEEETEKVMRDRQKTLADMIYAQMNEHFYHEVVDYKASKMRPFSRIEMSFGGKLKTDEIYDLRANIRGGKIGEKIFTGFKKACHTLYKFDSGPERDYAIVLENDAAVLKWMRPAAKQFHIYYGPGGFSHYEPDFVVETAERIYMVEIKMRKELKSEKVLQTARAGSVYCEAVTNWNAENGGKPWQYVLIADDDVRLNSSFSYLLASRVHLGQI